MPNGSPISSAMPRPLRDPTIGQILADERFDERRRQACLLDRVRRARQEFFFRLDCCQEFFVQRSGGRGGHRYPFDVGEASSQKNSTLRRGDRRKPARLTDRDDVPPVTEIAVMTILSTVLDTRLVTPFQG